MGLDGSRQAIEYAIKDFEMTLRKRKLAVYEAENSDSLRIMKDR